MISQDIPTVENLEELFVNNKVFDDIEDHINQFNPIKIMGMERMEIRHSAILAWLLTPNGSHGLGERFLKAFLAEAFQGRSAQNNLSSLSIIQEDFTDAEVSKERENIDIFIFNHSKKWAFIIENKFDSKQGKNQLKEYKEKVSKIYDPTNTGVKVYGIFLTLFDEEPNDPSYNPIKYNSIHEILLRLIDRHKNMMPPDVVTFLGHYLETIGKATGMDKQQNLMETLARKFYIKHKQALDFIIKHGTNTKFAFAAQIVFKKKSKYQEQVEIKGNKFIFHNLSNQTVSFLPFKWFNAFDGKNRKWQGCEKWFAELPLISYIELHPNTDGSSGKLRLYAEVGPISNQEFRSNLIKEIKNVAKGKLEKTIKFQSTTKNKSKKYSKFFTGAATTHQISDIYDVDEIAEGIRELLSSYEKEYQAVSTILKQFQNYGESKINT